MLRQAPEDVAKGSNDRPVEDIIIVDCGEVRARFFGLYPHSYLDPQLPLEVEVDTDGKQVPLHAEL
jgi:peptidyl-prolyl cis-trans isomerase B (cyclophilin B)